MKSLLRNVKDGMQIEKINKNKINYANLRINIATKQNKVKRQPVHNSVCACVGVRVRSK